MAGGLFEQATQAPQQPQGLFSAQADADPITKLSTIVGLDPKQFASPQEFLAAAWAKSPTDNVAAGVEALSKRFGIPAPWENQQPSGLFGGKQ